MLFIGIDPGLTGAVAAINEMGQIITVQDTPMLAVKKGKGTKHVYVETAMAKILESTVHIYGTSCITIENVHAMPGQGVTSMFSMGTGFGLWLGIAAALCIPIERMEPHTWKQIVGIPTGSDKNASIVLASRIFPSASLSRKKDHGRADALLIAEARRRRWAGHAAVGLPVAGDRPKRRPAPSEE